LFKLTKLSTGHFSVKPASPTSAMMVCWPAFSGANSKTQVTFKWQAHSWSITSLSFLHHLHLCECGHSQQQQHCVHQLAHQLFLTNHHFISDLTMDTNQLPKPIISRIPHPYNRGKAKGNTLATANSVSPSGNAIGKTGCNGGPSKGTKKNNGKSTPHLTGCDVDSDLDAAPDEDFFKSPEACIPMGNADSTTAGWQSACNHWNKVAKKVGNPKWEKVQGRTLTHDLLVIYFQRYFKYCADYPIPKNADDNLMPTKKDSKACMQGKTMVQYGGRVMRVWCERMPEHKDTTFKEFRGNDVPRWWVDLCADCLGRWKRNYQNNWKNTRDFEWGHHVVLPLSLHAIPPAFVNWRSQRELWYSHDVGEHHGRTGLAEWFLDLTRLVTNMLKRAFIEDNQPIHIHNVMRVVMQWHTCGRSNETSQANFQRWICPISALFPTGIQPRLSRK
jgi:hypothetical protein